MWTVSALSPAHQGLPVLVHTATLVRFIGFFLLLETPPQEAHVMARKCLPAAKA